MISASEKICPRCQSMKMKPWSELTGEQKMLVERLPRSADQRLTARKKHRFCTRCWFEDVEAVTSRV